MPAFRRSGLFLLFMKISWDTPGRRLGCGVEKLADDRLFCHDPEEF
jgi:hypothetical protein